MNMQALPPASADEVRGAYEELVKDIVGPKYWTVPSMSGLRWYAIYVFITTFDEPYQLCRFIFRGDMIELFNAKVSLYDPNAYNLLKEAFSVIETASSLRI